MEVGPLEVIAGLGVVGIGWHVVTNKFHEAYSSAMQPEAKAQTTELTEMEFLANWFLCMPDKTWNKYASQAQRLLKKGDDDFWELLNEFGNDRGICNMIGSNYEKACGDPRLRAFSYFYYVMTKPPTH